MTEESIFAAAVAKKTPQERAAYLDEACQGNAGLRAAVEELLSASAAAGSFFEHPPAGLDATVDAADHETHKPAGWDGSLAFLQPTDKPGRIGKLVGNAGEYEIIEVVGSGGMGIVLRAFDTKLSRVVAVKVLAPELARNPTAVKRFLREAKAAAAVVHDHVVTIHNVEETHQPPFLVMQYIDGQTLQQKIDRQGTLELKEILRIGCQAAAGLAAAHKHGLVHRDVKPANILLENGIERVKITDFGLARAADDVEITQTGLIAGTPQYMSPEQTRGEPLDARSDLFSLGSVLYTMCTGRPAFRADTTMGVLRRVCDDEPRPIHEANAEIPPWLAGIVDKLLAKDPGERYQTAAEVSELFGQCLAHAQNPEQAPLPPLAPAKETQPAAVLDGRIAGAVVLIAVLIGCAMLMTVLVAFGISGALAWYLSRSQRPAPPMAPVPEVVTDAARSPASQPGPALPEVQPYQGTQLESAWQPLFNGSDLAGWKTHPDQPGDWKVENGLLVGGGRVSHLFSERGDYQSFHLRFEATLNAGGDSGVLVRSPFAIEAGGQGPLGYEAQIAAKTGTVLVGQDVRGDPAGIMPGTWFTGEVIAAGKQIIVRINGQTTANFEDAERLYTKGHIALQVFSPQTVVQFRKIEIKELPAGAMADSTVVAAGTPAGAPRQEPTALIWGPVRDGWQVGIGWKNGKLRYAVGEKPEFELKVRNATDAEKKIRIVEPSDWDLWYSGGNELSVRIFGRDEQDVKLAPREEKTIDVPKPLIDLAGLASGTYRMKVTTDVGDKQHQPAADNFGFHHDGPAEPPFAATAEAPLKHPDAKYASVAWGQPVLGLSVGIRVATADTNPTRKRGENADDQVLEFFLWNSGTSAADVEYLSHHALDWPLFLRGQEGVELQSELILTGPKEQATKRLNADEVLPLGSSTLKRDWLADRKVHGPLAPGAYQVWTNFNCRRLDFGHLNLRIASGEVPITIK